METAYHIHREINGFHREINEFHREINGFYWEINCSHRIKNGLVFNLDQIGKNEIENIKRIDQNIFQNLSFEKQAARRMKK